VSPLPPILAAVAALVLGSCGPGPTDPQPGSPSRPAATCAPGTPSASPSASLGAGGMLDGPWLLVGRPGAMRLVPPDPAPDADPGAVPPPVPPGVTWASGDRRQGFVASVGGDGRIETLEAGGASPVATASASAVGPSWRPIRVRLRGGDLSGSAGFATLSPGGRTVAATMGDPASGAPDARLLVADSATGLATVITLNGRLDGRPPTWLGPGSVAISILDASDAPMIAVVDLASGRVTRWRGRGGPLAGSGDGRLVASAERTGGRVVVGPVAALGADGPWVEATGRHAGTSSEGQVGQLLLDETGTRLAVASIGVTGDAAAVTLYRRDAGGRWATEATRPLPSDATRVVLVGFDP
jgi:hypothetical protein